MIVQIENEIKSVKIYSPCVRSLVNQHRRDFQTEARKFCNTGYFRKRRLFSPYLRKSASTRSVFESYVRKSEPWSEPRHDVIVFKNLHPGKRIWKPPFSVLENAGYVWTVAVFREKSLRFRKYPATCGWGLINSECRSRFLCLTAANSS